MLREFISREELEVVEAPTTIELGVWLARNKLLFEGKCIESSLVISRALLILHTYQQANKHPSREACSPFAHLPTICKWMPLQEGKYNLYIDAIEADDLKWGVEAVIHDCRDEVLAAATWLITCNIEARIAKTMGMWWGLKFAKDLCFMKVVVDFDCLELIQAIRGPQ